MKIKQRSDIILFPPYRAGVLRLVHVVPAIRLDILGQPPALVLTQLLHRLGLNQHPVNGDGLLLELQVNCSTITTT